MTLIGRIFERPVDRPIEGVIKADDDLHLKQEVDEYVVTKEIERRLDHFLHAYNEPGFSNGVWISGFFGSGKSHLLKMLALVLENRDLGGVTAAALFRPKVEHDLMLAGLLDKAVRTPAHSILFNIDQKSDAITKDKDQSDALLAVFQKVFDEHRGYYGKQAHIARFERDLDRRGLLTPFRDAYARLAKKPWERGREEWLLEGGNVDRAVVEVAGDGLGEPSGVLRRYRESLRISIEDFAQEVAAHLDAQGPFARLNFLVDEVGQYIADNRKLMVNLQTVAESLATSCRGRAWVLVTAQQDMDTVVGELDRAQENDFSKIQARFAERMALTSADVDEVISARLLAKGSDARNEIAALYAREQANLRTLFTFADGSQQLRQFRDGDDFVNVYPFIPYQFPLLQQAIQGLSAHNGFEGRYSSVGERSMLQVFREAAIAVKERMVGDVAAFDLLYDGISPSLKADVQQSVLIASRNLPDPFAVRVLKALFLVKYVKGFKATARNVAILLTDKLTDDPAARLAMVEAALNTLEGQTYIRRDGELWEFLTNEEQDVDREIAQIEVDITEIRSELDKLFFDEIVRASKLRHEASGQDFPFTRRIDDQTIGRSYELGINITTPLHDAATAAAAAMRSVGHDELVALIAADDRFIRDLRTFLQTVRFARLETGQGSPTRQGIVRERGERNAELRRRLVDRARALLSEATFFARGEALLRGGGDGTGRVAAAFGQLVDKVHTSLPMLRGKPYGEKDVPAAFAVGATMDTGLTEPEREILNQAGRDTQLNQRTTARALVTKFGAKPYGWSYHAVLAIVAGLIARGRIETRLDGAVLDAAGAQRALSNDRVLESLRLEALAEWTPMQVRSLREFLRDMFDHDAPPAADARALGQDAATRLNALDVEIAEYLAQAGRYPFLAGLAPLAERVRAAKDKPAGWFLGEMDSAIRDALTEGREDLLDPVRSWWRGSGKPTHDVAADMLRDEAANLAHADPARVVALETALAADDAHKGEGGRRMRDAQEALRREIDGAVTQARVEATKAVVALMERVRAAPDFAVASDDASTAAEREGAATLAAIASARLVAVARDNAARFQAQTYPRLLAMLAPLPAPVTPSGSTGVEAIGAGGSSLREPVAGTFDPGNGFVAAHALTTGFVKPYLADEADVGAYLSALGEAMRAAVATGKRITV